MSNLQNEILVFKTNLDTNERVRKISPLLDKHSAIIQWNIDHHDVDKVLRIVAYDIEPGSVILLLNRQGIYCEELPD